MKATVMKLAGLGFLMGMVVGTLIVVIMGFGNGGSLVLPDRLLAATGSEAGALLAQMLVSGLFGMVPMAGAALYQLESWSMLKQALVHYATYMATFIAIGLNVGWLEPTLADIGIMAGFFAVGHTIIWLIMYARYRAEAKQLSMLVQKAKQNA